MSPHVWGSLRSDRRRHRRSCQTIPKARVGASEVECPTCRKPFMPCWHGMDPEAGVLMRCPTCDEFCTVSYVRETQEYHAKAR